MVWGKGYKNLTDFHFDEHLYNVTWISFGQNVCVLNSYNFIYRYCGRHMQIMSHINLFWINSTLLFTSSLLQRICFCYAPTSILVLKVSHERPYFYTERDRTTILCSHWVRSNQIPEKSDTNFHKFQREKIVSLPVTNVCFLDFFSPAIDWCLVVVKIIAISFGIRKLRLVYHQ